jgi:hypothetical protein
MTVLLLNEFVDHFEDRKHLDPSIIDAYRDIYHIAGELSTGTVFR